MTATVNFAGYDGLYMRYDVTEQWDGSRRSGGFLFENVRYSYINTGMPVVFDGNITHGENGDTVKRTYIKSYPLSDNASLDFVPALVGDLDTERVYNVRGTITKDRETAIHQRYEEGIDIGGGTKLGQFDISPFVIDILVSFPAQNNGPTAPELTASAQDGTELKLRAGTLANYWSGTKQVYEYYYIPDDPDTDLTKMKSFTLNGTAIDITGVPSQFGAPALTTVTEENPKILYDSIEDTVPTFSTDSDGEWLESIIKYANESGELTAEQKERLLKRAAELVHNMLTDKAEELKVLSSELVEQRQHYYDMLEELVTLAGELGVGEPYDTTVSPN